MFGRLLPMLGNPWAATLGLTLTVMFGVVAIDWPLPSVGGRFAGSTRDGSREARSRERGSRGCSGIGERGAGRGDGGMAESAGELQR